MFRRPDSACCSLLQHRGGRSAADVLGFLIVVLGVSCSTAATVVIRQLPEGVRDTQLLDAFRNRSVSLIQLGTDYAVGNEFDRYSGPDQDGNPYIPIDRNITITGLPGVDPVPMLDLQYKTGVLQLCDTCWLTLLNITVKDERMGANAQFDFFLGEGNSVINATNVVRNRRSCTDPRSAATLVERTTRSPRFLGPGNSHKQVFQLADLTWRGQLYPQTLHLQDYSVEFPRHYNGGYSVVLRNTWRLCHNHVDPSCLREKDADMCVFQHIDQLLKGQQQSNGPSQLNPGATAAIVVAVVGVVLVAAAAATLLCFRKRWQRRRGIDDPKDSSTRAADVEVGRPSGQLCDVAAMRDSNRGDPSGHGNSHPKLMGAGSGSGGGGGSGSGVWVGGGRGGSPPDSRQQSASFASLQPLPGSTASLNASLLCNVLTDLRFGVLLGTGSFGRVYKARLGDYDVAVKVIEHDSRMQAAVENEVALMLSCKHANVVAAFHYVTHKQDAFAAAANDTWDTNSSRQNAQPCPEPSTGNTPHTLGVTAKSFASSTGSSTHSMDRPIPVLPGPKPSRKPCPVCDVEVWPTPLGHHGSGSSTAQPYGSSSSSSVSTSSPLTGRYPRVVPGEVLKCTCSSRGTSEVQSGLLNWQHEGGFWPAGPSALIKQLDDSLEQEESGMVTTWLIQEYCDSGTLAKQAGTWSPMLEDDKQMIKRLMLLQDVVKGLSYLHGKQIVHGDLNARNVLVTTCRSSPCGLTAKLADFGLSRTIKQHNTHHTTCTVGTMSHQPPELLRHGRMSCAVDVYAFGIMMWELYTREVAFRELHYGQFFETVVLRNQRPPVPSSMPEDYKVLMQHCWSADPSDRPSTKALLECISLMVADRQHSLGLPVRSSVDLVDREFVRPHGSSDGSANKAVMQQLAQLQQQQQQQRQQQQQQQQQQDHHRQPTPARMPHQLQQQPSSAFGNRVVSPVHVYPQRQYHVQDRLGQFTVGHNSLHSSGHDSSAQQLTYSSQGTSSSLKEPSQDQCALIESSPAAAAAAAAVVRAPGAERPSGVGGVSAAGGAPPAEESESFLRDL